MLTWSNFRSSGAKVGNGLILSLVVVAGTGVAGGAPILVTGAAGGDGKLVLVSGAAGGGGKLLLVSGAAGAGGALPAATAAVWTDVTADLPRSADLRVTASTNAFDCAINASRSSIHFMTPPQPRKSSAKRRC
jgi:hypothetical protein